MKPRECSNCGKLFQPLRAMQSVCSPRCAAWLVKAKNAQGKRELRERKAALKSVPQLIKLAQAAFNAYIRERDRQAGHSCISCGRPLNWGEDGIRAHQVDAGHYRSTGSAPHLRFEKANCHAQCVSCNRHGSGRAVDYRIGLIKRIGIAEVERLEEDNSVRKWQRDELVAIRETYRVKLRELRMESL